MKVQRVSDGQNETGLSGVWMWSYVPIDVVIKSSLAESAYGQDYMISAARNDCSVRSQRCLCFSCTTKREET